MLSFLSDGAEYLDPAFKNLKNTTFGDFGDAMMGRGKMAPIQKGVKSDVSKLLAKMGVGKRSAISAGRFAGRALPLLSVISNVQEVGDIVAGPDSLANKGMDTVAMGTGAVIGGLMGGGVFSPLTASIGASVGKTVSDGAQWLFGDKKSAEQRKMEEALMALKGGI